MAEILFYVLAAGAVAFGAGVVAARNPLYCVLHLLGAFFCLAVVYLLAGFQFLAATQLLVYVGAIMVLFLFVVMLLNLGDESRVGRDAGFALSGRRMVVAAASAGVLALVGVFTAGWADASAAEPGVERASAATPPGGYDALGAVTDGDGVVVRQGLASRLFSRYMLPFEAASLLLLATMIAVVMLAKRQRPGRAEEPAELGWPYGKEVEL